MISKTLSTSQKRAALHQVVPGLAEFCQQLYPLIVAHADDFGRLSGEPFTVKHAVDPTSPRLIPDFEMALLALHQVGLIVWYAGDEDRRFIQVTQFDGHQSGLHKRTASKFPEVPENFLELPGDANSLGKGTSGNFPEIPSEEKRTELKGTEEKKGSLWTSSTDTATEAEPLTDPTGRSRLTADDIVSLWNRLVSTPIPQVTKLTADRRSKIESRLKTYPDEATWQSVIAWVNTQDWCRAPGRGDHPNWTASIDWLCKNDGAIAKCLERAAAEKANGRRQTDQPNRSSAPVSTEYTPAVLRRIQNARVHP